MTAAATKLTAEQLKAEQRAVDAVRSLPVATKQLVINHLANLHQKEVAKALTLTEAPQLYRAQGAVASLEKVLALLAPDPQPRK